MAKKTVKDINLQGKKVIMRADFNVPLDADRKITDETRIVKTLPTIQYILEQGASLVLMSHLGRPKGERQEKYSLKPVADRLSEHLSKPVRFVDDCIGEKAQTTCDAVKPGEVILLENLRFHKEEEKNDEAFARELAGLAEVYINDAFGTAHRAHASTEGIAQHLPAAAGFLLEKELAFLGDAMENPTRPFVAIIGGAKISGKIDVIKALLPKVDKLVIGGGMAYTFYKAQGKEVGNSLLEADKVELAGKLLNEAGDKLVMPLDTLVTDALDFDNKTLGDTHVVSVDAIPADWEGVEIGDRSIAQITEIIKTAKTVVWNGPMGVAEIDASAKGTNAVARALAEATADNGAVTVVGGGDSVAAITKAGLGEKVSHISTGGGASLEFLEGKTLPGVAALNDK